MTEIVPLLGHVGSLRDATARHSTSTTTRRGDAVPRVPRCAATAGPRSSTPAPGRPGTEPFLPEREAAAERWRAACSRTTIDAVLLTHLHVDHVGWDMLDGAPFFPNARYVAHRADFEFFAQHEARTRRTFATS